MFDIEYYNRYNQRIFVPASTVSGTPVTGAISNLVENNLTANRALVSDLNGKIVVSLITDDEILALDGVTSNIQAQLDAKQGVVTTGDLTEATSSVLTITGGTDSVIGSGVSIQVKLAGSGQGGYLSSADWTTFNAKISPSLASGYLLVGNGSGVATGVAVTGDVTISNTGVTAISAGVIVNADVKSDAAIALSKLAALTANRATVTSAAGEIIASTVTDTALGYIANLTSDAQAQINDKLTVNLSGAADGDILYRDAGLWVNLPIGSPGFVLGSTGTTVQWVAPTANGLPTGGTLAQFLTKSSSTDYESEWTTLTASLITDLTATAADINILTGLSSTVSSTEIGYLDGVTGVIQTQLDGKLSKTLTYNSIFVGNGSNVATAYGVGTNNQVLTVVGGSIAWQDPTPPGDVSGPGSSTDRGLASWNGTSGDALYSATATIDASNNLAGIANVTFATGSALRTGVTAANTLLLQAYDVDGTAYTTFATLTAGDTPTMDLATGVTIGSAYMYRVGGTDVTVADGGTGVGTISALSVWVANSANTIDEVTPSAGQSIRINAGGTAWEAYTPGGGGITNGAAANELMKSDGTNATPSGVFIPSLGSLDLGSASISSSRVITAVSSDSDSSISLVSKGTGVIGIRNVTDSFNSVLDFYTNSSEIAINARRQGGAAISNFIIRSADGENTAGLESALNIMIAPGAKYTGGKNGNIGFFTQSVSDWQDMEYGLYLADVVAAPTDNPVSGIWAWSSSEPEGSNLKVRTTAGHFAKPWLQVKVTIAGGATLRAIGASPQTIIAAPGSGKYLAIWGVSVSYKYGTVVYDFSGTEHPIFKFSGGTTKFQILNTLMNSGSSFNRILADSQASTDKSREAPTNTAFILTTDDGGDATTGDGDLDIVVYYTVESENA